MNKYLAVFRISFKQEFVYRLNFIMWRARNLMQFFLVFFLWSSVLPDPSREVFGYNRARILTYVFGILIIKAIVYSSRSIDIAGEIARGDLSNYLLKPFSYFKYWFTRDVSSKCLNLVFAVFEAGILFLLLKPAFFFQTNPLTILLFVISLAAALVLYFFLIFLFNLIPFWLPEQGWASLFLFMIFSDFLGGGVFPVDVFPAAIQRVIYSTPFPYLLFVPLQIYLGKFDLAQSVGAMLMSFGWIIILMVAVRSLWFLGLKTYKAEGR